MANFLPIIIRKIPSILLNVWGDPYIPEQEKPVLTKRGRWLLIAVALGVFIALYFIVPAGANFKKWLEIYSFGLSAILWFAAATIPTPLPLAYPSGPPAKVIKRVNCQTLCNQAGAVCAAIGLIVQSL